MPFTKVQNYESVELSCYIHVNVVQQTLSIPASLGSTKTGLNTGVHGCIQGMDLDCKDI